LSNKRVLVGFDSTNGRYLCGRKREFCFGAAGAECDSDTIIGPPLFGDSPVPVSEWVDSDFVQKINGGSWKHDECSFDNPMGKGCEHGPLDEFGHDGHCALDGSLVTANDTEYCCSASASPYIGTPDQVAQKNRQGWGGPLGGHTYVCGSTGGWPWRF